MSDYSCTLGSVYTSALMNCDPSFKKQSFTGSKQPKLLLPLIFEDTSNHVLI